MLREKREQNKNVLNICYVSNLYVSFNLIFTIKLKDMFHYMYVKEDKEKL